MEDETKLDAQKILKWATDELGYRPNGGLINSENLELNLESVQRLMEGELKRALILSSMHLKSQRLEYLSELEENNKKIHNRIYSANKDNHEIQEKIINLEKEIKKRKEKAKIERVKLSLFNKKSFKTEEEIKELDSLPIIFRDSFPG
ncbi:hypothetical protein AYI68_g8371 [Smittium mucronatum]|uniref:Uncharacterized protein n=1 Tax=Smittium mucronatum TaxID=133383 RepID=A0A1R0GL28_9FUNG|nr:hypothetical protein AYI68_g8371 [Smittium mucronatum]